MHLKVSNAFIGFLALEHVEIILLIFNLFIVGVIIDDNSFVVADDYRLIN